MKLHDRINLPNQRADLASIWQMVDRFADSSNEIIEIYQMEQFGFCPAMPLFLRVYAELLEKGWANPFIAWSNKNRVVWAQRKNKILGGICYDYQHDLRMGWIILSFIDPSERGQGLYGKLHTAFEKDIKSLGGLRISSYVHVDNTSRLVSAEKVGLKPMFYRMHKFL